MINATQLQFSDKRLSVILAFLAIAGGVLAGMIVLNVGDSWKIILALTGLAFVVAILKRIEYGLLLLVFLTYTNFFSIAGLHGAPPLGKLLILFLISVILVNAIFRGEYPTGWLRPVLIILSFGVVGLFSLSYAINLQLTTKALREFAESAALAALVILLLQNARFFRHVIWTLICAGFLMATLGVYQYLTGTWSNDFGGFAQADIRHITGDEDGYRISGPIGDANFYAQILIVLIPLSLERFWREKSKILRLVAAAAVLMITLAIIFTFSRGAFLAFCLTLGLTLIWIRPPIKHCLIALLLALPLLALVPGSYMERMKTMLELIPGMGRGVQADAAFRGRASEYRAAWMMFQDHPIGGVGLGNYRAHYQKYSQMIGLDWRLQDRSAHSLYLQIAAETGVAGLSVFAIILGCTLHGLRLATKRFLAAEKKDSASLSAAFMVALIGYLVAGMFLHTAYPDYLWILIGIGLALPIAAQNELFVKEEKKRLKSII